MITIGGNSLDLSRPIFAVGRICLRDDWNAINPSETSETCPATDTRMPITVDRVAANRIGEPVLYVELNAEEGIVAGWASFKNFRN